MFDLIVMRVAEIDLHPFFGINVSRALMQLTGLQKLDLSGTCFLCCLDGGVVCIAGKGGLECVF